MSIRTPPTVDSEAMFEDVVETLIKDVPFNYKVSIERPQFAKGWNSKPRSETLEKSLNDASQKVYGGAPVFTGGGGSIPFA